MPTAVPLREALHGLGWRGQLPALTELADGLAELHRLSVAHRDIKPENAFKLEESYRFGDFGIAAFPERTGVTRMDEPMGPATYLAPEMEANTEDADPFAADVYSLAKTVWAVLSNKKFAFSGQYASTGVEALGQLPQAENFFLEPLEELLVAATESKPERRPSAAEFATRLREVAALQYDFDSANPLQWEYAGHAALKGSGLTRAIWTDPSEIARVVNLLSKQRGMNHCIYPEGGGMHLSGATVCEGGAMVALHIREGGADHIVKPLQLTLERFPKHPSYGYAVLQTMDTAPLGADAMYMDGPVECLRRLNDFDYVVDDSDEDEPRYDTRGMACHRRFEGGLFVIAPTRGLYNRIDTYLGTASALGLEGLRVRFAKLLDEELEAKTPQVNSLRAVVRLQSATLKRVPFELNHISQDVLWKLMALDDALTTPKDELNGPGLVTGRDVIRRMRTQAEDPSRKSARELLGSFSSAQRAEYMSMVDVARGVTEPEHFRQRTETFERQKFEDHYLLEKLGCGYIRKCVGKFGLEVVEPGADNA